MQGFFGKTWAVAKGVLTGKGLVDIVFENRCRLWRDVYRHPNLDSETKLNALTEIEQRMEKSLKRWNRPELAEAWRQARVRVIKDEMCHALDLFDAYGGTVELVSARPEGAGRVHDLGDNHFGNYAPNCGEREEGARRTGVTVPKGKGGHLRWTH